MYFVMKKMTKILLSLQQYTLMDICDNTKLKADADVTTVACGNPQIHRFWLFLQVSFCVKERSRKERFHTQNINEILLQIKRQNKRLLWGRAQDGISLEYSSRLHACKYTNGFSCEFEYKNSHVTSDCEFKNECKYEGHWRRYLFRGARGGMVSLAAVTFVFENLSMDF